MLIDVPKSMISSITILKPDVSCTSRMVPPTATTTADGQSKSRHFDTRRSCEKVRHSAQTQITKATSTNQNPVFETARIATLSGKE